MRIQYSATMKRRGHRRTWVECVTAYKDPRTGKLMACVWVPALSVYRWVLTTRDHLRFLAA